MADGRHIVTRPMEVHVSLGPRDLAAAFCDMSDEGQAQFFIEVAMIAAEWDGPMPQWYMVGRHLRTCGCSNEGARQLVREIASGVGEER